MSFSKFLHRRNVERSTIDETSNDFPDFADSDGVPPKDKDMSIVKDDKEYVQWSEVYFDDPKVTQHIEKVDFWRSFTEMEIYNCYLNVIKAVCTIKTPIAYIHELIRFVTKKLFGEFAETFDESEFNDEMFSEDEFDFESKITLALYFACRKFNLDFSKVFTSIKDIPLFENDSTVYTFSWSFGCFTGIPERYEEFEPTESSNIVQESCETIKSIFLKHFDEFVENAYGSDIDALVNFEIKYEKYITFDVFEHICDCVIGTPEFKTSRIDVIEAIAKHFPSIAVQVFTEYFYSILRQRNANLSEELIYTLQTIADLHDYRSEEFYDLAFKYKHVLNNCMSIFDGQVLNVVYEVFNKSFNISKQELDDVILTRVNNVIFKLTGIDASDILTISKWLSNKVVFNYVYRCKPSIIQALS